MSTLIEIITELGASRLGEVNLLLNVMTKGTRERQTIIKDIFGFAGATDQIPRPDLYIPFALSIGLLIEHSEELTLTPLGLRVYEESLETVDTFTPAQIHLISPELFGHPEVRLLIANALECFERVAGTQVYRLKEVLSAM